MFSKKKHDSQNGSVFTMAQALLIAWHQQNYPNYCNNILNRRLCKKEKSMFNRKIFFQ
jgi:hypothetical protein